MATNITGLSYEEWVAFIFDHPVPEKTDDAWYWGSESEYAIGDRAVLLERVIRLFHSPEFLLSRYTLKQIGQGFWFMIGTGGFMDILWYEVDAPDVALREATIRAMASLFEKLFAAVPAELESCFMWWDMLGFACPKPSRFAPAGDEAQLHQAAFETCCEILEFDSRHCQRAALHGLGHLMHAGTRQVVNRWLVSRWNDLDEELRNYAVQAREGTVN